MVQLFETLESIYIWKFVWIHKKCIPDAWRYASPSHKNPIQNNNFEQFYAFIFIFPI